MALSPNLLFSSPMQVCSSPDFQEPGCSVGVETWWPAIAEAVAASENFVAGTCNALDESCGAPPPPPAARQDAWNCDSCQGRLGDLSAVLSDPEATAPLIAYLKGPALCGSFDDQDDIDGCRFYIDAFMPAAFPVLAGVLAADSQRLCADVYGIC